jgi:hypothetical protein
MIERCFMAYRRQDLDLGGLLSAIPVVGAVPSAVLALYSAARAVERMAVSIFRDYQRRNEFHTSSDMRCTYGVTHEQVAEQDRKVARLNLARNDAQRDAADFGVIFANSVVNCVLLGFCNLAMISQIKFSCGGDD